MCSRWYAGNSSQSTMRMEGSSSRSASHSVVASSSGRAKPLMVRVSPAAAGLAFSAGQGGEDGQRVTLLDGRVQLVKEADVLIVQVYVHEAMELSVRDQDVLEAGIMALQVVQQLAHGGAFTQDGSRSAHQLLEIGRHLHLNCHLAS